MSVTYTWNGKQNDDWANAANWTPPSRSSPGVPDSSNATARIDSGSVSISGEFVSIGTLLTESTAATLSLSSSTLDAKNVTIAAGTVTVGARSHLNVDDAMSLNGELIINGGSVDAGSASLGTHGTVDLTGGSLTFDGTLTMAAGSLIEVTSGTASAGDGHDQIGAHGTILANGGTLLLDTRAVGSTVVIGDSSKSEVDITGDLSRGATVHVDFQGPAGTFAYSGVPSFETFDVSGLNAAKTETNRIEVSGPVWVVGSGHGSGSSGTVLLSNGDWINLSNITQQTGSAWQVETTPDGSCGTDIWLKAVCYAAGTNLLTPDGERAVEMLREGDLVITVEGEQQVTRPVRWIGWRHIDLTRHPEPSAVAPVRIMCGAIAEQVPHRDLLVSPDHAIYVRGQLVAARQLINGETIRQETDWASVDYYHVELDQHALLLAEGLTAESYLDTGNRNFFANGGEPLVLHPDLTSEADQPQREDGSCAPFVWQEDDVRPIWQQLADRAHALGYQMTQPDVASDPALRVMVDGQDVRPIQASPGHCTFLVPPNAISIRLLSRVSSPADARPWHNDCRRRGIRVHRIILRQGNDVQDVPLDHPSLCSGWLAVERGGPVMRRWTNGEAELWLQPNETMTTVELRYDTDALEYVLPLGAEALAA